MRARVAMAIWLAAGAALAQQSARSALPVNVPVYDCLVYYLAGQGIEVRDTDEYFVLHRYAGKTPRIEIEWRAASPKRPTDAWITNATTTAAAATHRVTKPAQQLEYEQRLTNNVQRVFDLRPPYSTDQYAALARAGLAKHDVYAELLGNAAATSKQINAAAAESARVNAIFALVALLRDTYPRFQLYSNNLGAPTFAPGE